MAVLVFEPDGGVWAVAHPAADRELLRALGRTTRRLPAGRVRPARGLWRAAFRLLPRPLGRRLPGPWLVELPDGRVLGPFPRRAEALRAEEAAAAGAFGLAWR